MEKQKGFRNPQGTRRQISGADELLPGGQVQRLPKFVGASKHNTHGALSTTERPMQALLELMETMQKFLFTSMGLAQDNSHGRSCLVVVHGIRLLRGFQLWKQNIFSQSWSINCSDCLCPSCENVPLCFPVKLSNIYQPTCTFSTIFPHIV